MVYVHRPEKPNGTSVLICAGGGYFAIAIGHEGHELAKWFNKRGITAFVLKYRVARSFTNDPVRELMGKMGDFKKLD